MKIGLIGPGIMPIPPPGWGAVEILIWDYYNQLIDKGHEVIIVNKMRSNGQEQMNPNSNYCRELIDQINTGNFDFVHIHYDCLFHIMSKLKCKNKGFTSHYPYIDQLNNHRKDGYDRIFNASCLNYDFTIFALSNKDYNMYKTFCANPDKLCLMLNGANESELNVCENKNELSAKSIYLGKIEERKQQYKYCNIKNIDFYGRCDDSNFKVKNNYKGEPSREELLKLIPNYGNMVLLSLGENGTPLVLKEALMAGLPIVINEYSSNDLDLTLPFIDVIDKTKLDDTEYIETIIENNRNKQNMKHEICEYAHKNFSWTKLVDKYIENIKQSFDL